MFEDVPVLLQAQDQATARGTMQREPSGPSSMLTVQTDHHAWVVLRLLVEHVLGEPLVSAGEILRQSSVDAGAVAPAFESIS